MSQTQDPPTKEGDVPMTDASAGPGGGGGGGGGAGGGPSPAEWGRGGGRARGARSSLPVSSEPAPARPRARHERECTAPTVSRRILVVDDERISATSLAKLLQIKGHEIRTAHDGLEAVGVADEFRPDVVLLDIGLPKMNGYDVAQRIRQQPWGQGMVLTALTGWGQETDRQRSQAAGFDYHLVKPVAPSALADLLASLP